MQPFVDEYISRRYDDTAVVIYEELRSGRGLRNCYVTWLEAHLAGFPENQRNKYSLLRTSTTSSAAQTQGESNTKGGSEQQADYSRDVEEQQGAVVRINTATPSSKFCTIL